MTTLILEGDGNLLLESGEYLCHVHYDIRLTDQSDGSQPKLEGEIIVDDNERRSRKVLFTIPGPMNLLLCLDNGEQLPMRIWRSPGIPTFDGRYEVDRADF